MTLPNDHHVFYLFVYPLNDQQMHNLTYFVVWGPGRSVGIPTDLPGWTVRGSNPGGSEIFRNRPDRPWGPPNLLYNEYRVFHGGKAAGAWC
jgi:hypothetical protein